MISLETAINLTVLRVPMTQTAIQITSAGRGGIILFVLALQSREDVGLAGHSHFE